MGNQSPSSIFGLDLPGLARLAGEVLTKMFRDDDSVGAWLFYLLIISAVLTLGLYIFGVVLWKLALIITVCFIAAFLVWRIRFVGIKERQKEESLSAISQTRFVIECVESLETDAVPHKGCFELKNISSQSHDIRGAEFRLHKDADISVIERGRFVFEAAKDKGLRNWAHKETPTINVRPGWYFRTWIELGDKSDGDKFVALHDKKKLGELLLSITGEEDPEVITV